MNDNLERFGNEFGVTRYAEEANSCWRAVKGKRSGNLSLQWASKIRGGTWYRRMSTIVPY